MALPPRNRLPAARLPPPPDRLKRMGLVGVTALFLIVLTMQGHVGSFVKHDNIQLIFNQNAIRMTAVLGMLSSSSAAASICRSAPWWLW